LVAIGLFAVVVLVLVKYPFAQIPVAIGLCVYSAILYRYPNAWLVVIPALLPVLDLAPWSGWFFLDEFDLLILITVAVSLLRERVQQPISPMPVVLKVAIGSLALSYVASLFLGLLPLEPLDANAFANYFSRYNSLRVAKGFFWAVLLFYLMRGSVSQSSAGDTKRLVGCGMIAGLTLLDLFVLYERFLFAGVFNFSSDLRAIATFSGLHNGGNDIEAYLVFAAPFIVAWVFDHRSLSRYFVGAALFALTSYSLLVTFSRGGYLGFLVAWIALIICLLMLTSSGSFALPPLKAPSFAVFLVLLGAGVALPILRGDFIRARFATVALDWQSRMDQLQNTFRMMDTDLMTSLFGMGLGRYPATYLGKQPVKSTPTVYTFERESQNSFIRIKAGSPLYIGQWIGVKPGKFYVLSLDVRSVNRKGGGLSVPICEKQLQKSYRCHSFQFPSSRAGVWEHFETRFNMGEVGGDVGRVTGRFSRRPVELALYDAGRGSVLDVDNVKLLDDTGTNLVSNGDFSSGHDRWFFTVDDLMPWQTSNHWGQIFFEQGWFGLLSFNLAVLSLSVFLFLRSRRGDLFSAAGLSGIFGFLTVGLFGSLFDTPRMAMLFYFGSLLPFLSPVKVPVLYREEPVSGPVIRLPVSFGWLSPAPLLRRKAVRVVIVAGIVLLVAMIGKEIYDQSFEEVRVDESKLPQLPAPDQLPAVSLPNFRFAHPRLPAPASEDIIGVESGNPGYFESLARSKSDVFASTLLAYVHPGTRDPSELYNQLLGLDFGFRGNRVKSIALAYDWLYDQWTEEQRKGLREKLLDGCHFLVKFIREERLSPYNVILYNAPFQNLMACSLAVYGDDPRAEPVMRFANDLWKNRVLPVWRQIMGKNGGWHEGGEYVHIGIGQAIYQVPAMWRVATGEDVFRSEPGIRGFLDFLIYRARPDDTIMRIGDAAYFLPWLSPDYLPLAIEYRHAEAYSVRPPPARPAPTSWPWGPIAPVPLYDPQKLQQLPLARLFDGVGLMVSRTDWTPNATYVTFKAGDNFWSHSHLDQGSFTIYKGGALAIDSGLYGPKYGSDHHLNYTYQTVAHNIITVTDPDDVIPAPGEKGPRSIANDGGQRRVGSGWGVEAAPLDLDEWNLKREIYHTAQLEKAFIDSGLVVGVADLTSAYTNRLSGKRTFSHRTRRVERLWRTFGHDQVDDVIVIFDRVRSTDPNFRKRWLLHTLEEPKRTEDGFLISVSPTDKPGHSGGRLQGHVLLPKVLPVVQVVGGPGAEFLVDGRNYDEDGAVAKAVASRKDEIEAGQWRIELMPAALKKDDVFLVVLIPQLWGERDRHRVRLLESDGLVGCEISTPTRTTRWWFEEGRNGVRVEIGEGGRTKTIDARGGK